jgi:hypothetical protein
VGHYLDKEGYAILVVWIPDMQRKCFMSHRGRPFRVVAHHAEEAGVIELVELPFDFAFHRLQEYWTWQLLDDELLLLVERSNLLPIHR